jgi:hypothetical protein
VAPTPLEAANAIYAAYIAMLGYNWTTRASRPTRACPSWSMTCGTDIGASVMQAVTQDILDTGAGTKDNPLKSMRAAGISPRAAVVTPRISTTAKMQVWNASPGAKALLIQRNSKGSKLSMKGAGSEFEHDNDSWEYALKEVGEAGFGRPWEANQTEFT